MTTTPQQPDKDRVAWRMPATLLNHMYQSSVEFLRNNPTKERDGYVEEAGSLKAIAKKIIECPVPVPSDGTPVITRYSLVTTADNQTLADNDDQDIYV